MRILDPTTTWFEHAMELYKQWGEHGSYFQQKFGDLLERKRRGADAVAASELKIEYDLTRP